MKISPVDIRNMPVGYVTYYIESLNKDLKEEDPWILPPKPLKL